MQELSIEDIETALAESEETAAEKPRLSRAQVRVNKKKVARWLQEGGMSRFDARRAVYGMTRAQATSHPTRRRRLADRVGVVAAQRRTAEAKAEALDSAAERIVEAVAE